MRSLNSWLSRMGKKDTGESIHIHIAYIHISFGAGLWTLFVVFFPTLLFTVCVCVLGMDWNACSGTTATV